MVQYLLFLQSQFLYGTYGKGIFSERLWKCLAFSYLHSVDTIPVPCLLLADSKSWRTCMDASRTPRTRRRRGGWTTPPSTPRPRGPAVRPPAPSPGADTTGWPSEGHPAQGLGRPALAVPYRPAQGLGRPALAWLYRTDPGPALTHLAL